MPTPAPKPFRDLVERRLAAEGMSKYELGQRAGLSANLVYRWWRDLTPTDVSLRKIAPVLNVPLEDLMRAAGRLDATETAEDLAPSSAVAEALGHFAGAIRGVPEQFQLAVIRASIRLAEAFPDAEQHPSVPRTAVTGEGTPRVTEPKTVGNRAKQADDQDLRFCLSGEQGQKPRRGARLLADARAIVTPRSLATSVPRL